MTLGCPLPCTRTLARRAPAASSSATPSAGSADWPWRRSSTRRRPGPPRSPDRSAAKAPHLPAKAKSVIFLFMAGGPSHLETFDPKPLLNKLEGQTRPKEFGEAKYQFVQRNARLLGTRRKFKKYGQSGIEVSDLFPETARMRRRPGRDPLVPRRHGRPLGGPVRAVHRPGHARVPEHGLVGPVRPGFREPVAAGIRRDARSDGRGRSRPADVRQRLPAGGLPAHDVPRRRSAGAQPRSARRRYKRPADADAEADSRAERGDARPD